MLDKDMQYISTIKYKTQVKVGYKKIDNNELESIEQSNFLSNDEVMSSDLSFKLNEWQKDCPLTYISSLVLDMSEKIVNKIDSKDLADYDSIFLNDKENIVIKKEKVFELEHYFSNTGIDYIFSPFQLLYEYIAKNSEFNMLTVLNIDSKLYLIIVDQDSHVVYSKVLAMTSFKNIKDSDFYESDAIGQKLFDELYYLELQSCLKKSIQEFYDIQSSHFIAEVNILYETKQLSQEQLESLQTDIVIKIKYNTVSISELMYDLASNKDTYIDSFTDCRAKKKSSVLINTSIATLIFSLFLAVYVYFNQDTLSFFDKSRSISSVENTFYNDKINNQAVSLLNHINKNKEIKSQISTLIESIPYNVLLKKLEINKDNSLMYISILKKDIYLKYMQPIYLKIYKSSDIKFDKLSSNKEAVIHNKNLFEREPTFNTALPKYSSNQFMPLNIATKYIKTILPKKNSINFKSTFKSDVTTYNYKIVLSINNPVEFFDLIDNINKELYSINIVHPIKFIKEKNNISVEFNLQFHQNK